MHTISRNKNITDIFFSPPILYGVVSLLAFIALYWFSIADLIHVWNKSGTYSHGYIIPILTIYLIYKKKDELKLNSVAPSLFLLLPLSLVLVIWFFAFLSDTKIIELTLLPLIFVFTYVSILGYKSSALIIFPLLYLLLATPIWDIIIPALQKAAVIANEFALKVTGIPTHINGTIVSIPAGKFKVEGGCSGINYLVAMLSLSTFYALITYKKLRPIIIILSVSIIYAIILNWIRIYIIILVGHYSDMKNSLVYDHVNFGWVLYGLGLYPLYITSKKLIHKFYIFPKNIDSNVQESNNTVLNRYFPIFPITLICIASIYAYYLKNKELQTLSSLTQPAASFPWVGPIHFTGWKPNFHGELLKSNLLYLDTNKETDIALHIYYFGKQTQDNELINDSNNISDGNIINSEIVSPNDKIRIFENIIVQPDQSKRIVWSWFYINNTSTINRLAAKRLQIQELFSGRATSSLISISAQCKISCNRQRKAVSLFYNKHITAISNTLRY